MHFWSISVFGTEPVALPSIRLRHALLWRLMVLVVGVLVLASVLVLVLGILPMAQRQAETAFQAANERVATTLSHIQESTDKALVAGRWWWFMQHPSVDDPQGFNDFFMPILHAAPLVTSVVAGTTRGEGWLLLQLPEDHWRNRLTDVSRWGKTQRFLHHSPDGMVRTETAEQDYDPRLRPWYQAAMKLPPMSEVAWTPPYTFFTTGDPGITASIRLHNEQGQVIGALGLDLMLRDLSKTTQSAQVGHSGVVFVMTKDERVLALPKPPASKDPQQWLSLLLQPVHKLEIPAIDAALAHWHAGGEQTYSVASLAIEGQDWLASAIPYQLGPEQLWIFTLAPTAYFSPNWTALTIGMVGVILLLSLLAWWLAQVQANRVVKPLEELAQQSERIGQLQFEPPMHGLQTPIYEIRQLSDAHEHMRQLLHEHQTELNVRITALEEAKNEIHRLAFYDALTQLPNRRLLMTRLTQALMQCQHNHQPGAVLFIDLDNFKALNDTLGHTAGDLFLQHVAQRLQTCVSPSTTVARLGGDEFLIVLECLYVPQTANSAAPEDASLTPASATQQVHEIAQRILQALGQPVLIKGTEHVSTPSIGAVLFFGHERAEDVLKWADMAMYQAKAAGRNGLRFFDPVFQTLAEHKAQLELDLRHALKLGQFEMWLQPQFDRQRRVAGAEALLRWPHPTRGWINPSEFIPIAESSGLIVPLGHWVLEQACALLQQWAAQPHTAHWALSVNVSVRQFRHPDFVNNTLALIERTGIRPNLLCLELTESILLDDVPHTIERMGLLRQRGVSFSLDDFGTGYSSLAYLKQLPFIELKIDQSFVRDMMTDPSDAMLAQSIIVLAHAFGLRVLAEGVETEGQFAALSKDGCDLFQGYLLGKPSPIVDFEERWAKISSWY